MNKYDETVKMLEDTISRLNNGCGSSICVIKKHTGQVVNGPCQCTPQKIKRDLKGIAEFIESEFNWDIKRK